MNNRNKSCYMFKMDQDILESIENSLKEESNNYIAVNDSYDKDTDRDRLGYTEYTKNDNTSFEINSKDKSFSHIEYMDEKKTIPKKMPILLNNLHTMYDLNSERTRKRSEQMKKRKEKLEIVNNVLETSNEHKGVKSKVVSTKVFKEENEVEMNRKSIENSLDLANNSTRQANKRESETQPQEEPEVLVSDLECDIEEVKDYNILNTNNKSFVPISNTLKSRSEQRKHTPSYMMALFQYEDSDSSQHTPNEIEHNDNMGHKNDIDSHKNKNYIVSDVIEEESENNVTVSELSYRKKSSFLFTKKKSSINSQSDASSLYFNSPNNRNKQMFNFSLKSNSNTQSNGNTITANTFNMLNNQRHSLSDTFNNNQDNLISLANCERSSNRHHKSSKSELINIHIDMKKILDNIQVKISNENESRIEKMASRKKILLNKFSKSYSHHNFTYNINIPRDNEDIETAIITTPYLTKQQKYSNNKQLSICNPNSNFDNLYFKKLSPSGASRAMHYDNYEVATPSKDKLTPEQKEKEEQTSIMELEDDRIDLDADFYEQDTSLVLIKEDNEYMHKSITEEDEDEDINFEQSSIVEIKDDDINFEQELNMKLEENNIVEKLDNDNENQDENIDLNNSRISNSNNNSSDDDKNIFDLSPSICDKSQTEKKKYTLFAIDDTMISQGDKFNLLSISKPDVNKNLLSMFNNASLKKDIELISNENKETKTISEELCVVNNILANPNFKELAITHPVMINIPSIEDKNEKNYRTSSGTIYNNNYINNNINNISISIVSDNKNARKKVNRTKNNSITYDIRKKYKHYKSPSVNLVNKTLEERLRSNSVNKNQQISININHMNYENNNISINTNTGNGSNTNAHNNLRNSITKKNWKPSGLTTPKKSKLNKADLKHFLTYSDTKFENNYTKGSGNKMELNFNCNHDNIRVNSETSLSSLLTHSNKQVIEDAMKSLKFHPSSLDHQRYSLEKLTKSKSKFFCLLICQDSTEKFYEFKGLYEINIDKNNMTKIYSVNYYPNNIEFSEIKSFYHFDSDTNEFKSITGLDIKKMTSDIHGFYMKYNYKKYLKHTY